MILNSEISNKYLQAFCELYNVISLIRNPTCFKNHGQPKCIATMPLFPQTNHSFQSSCTIDIGLSDFHRLIVTVLKTNFNPSRPAHFRKLYWNKNVRPLRPSFHTTFWGTAKKYKNKNLSQFFLSWIGTLRVKRQEPNALWL